MSRSSRRIVLLIVALPLLLVAVALIYSEMMARLEHTERDFWASLQWATETFTSTGYGNDSRWTHPFMVLFVIVVQLLGVATVFLVFPFYLVPFIEDRFEGRLPARPPRRLRDYVLVYRWGPAVVQLVGALRSAKIPVLVFEEDEAAARRIRDRGIPVIYGSIDEGDPNAEIIQNARAIVANGRDHENGALILSARQQGFPHRILAIAKDPFHRAPMLAAGAQVVYTPTHILAAALAARASDGIEPTIMGLSGLEGLRAGEARVSEDTLASAATVGALEDACEGVQVMGIWRRERFIPLPSPEVALAPRDLLTLVRVGAHEVPGQPCPDPSRDAGLVRTRTEGPIIIGGFGEVGKKVAELLRDTGETVRIIDRAAQPGVDVVGDLLDATVLRTAEIASAKAIVIALSSDASTTFAASVIRTVAPHAPLVCRLNREHNTERINAAGSDFSMSLAAVAARMLRRHLMPELEIASSQALAMRRIPASQWTASGLVQRDGEAPSRVVGYVHGAQVRPVGDGWPPDAVLLVCSATRTISRRATLPG